MVQVLTVHIILYITHHGASFNRPNYKEAMDLRYDVVVVGAGLQGLAAARKFLQLDQDLNLTVIDCKETIGGVWAEEQLYTGLSTNNLRGTYEYTDLPMDDSFGVKKDEHIPGKCLHEYLDHYAKKFDLKRRIQFHTKVKVAEKIQDGWDLQLENVTSKGHILNGENEAAPTVPAQWNISCAKLIIATGLMSVPKPIYFRGLENFTGPVFNFADYAREAPKIYEDDAINNVTVMGSGKSASDCVYLMAAHGKTVNWIIRASGHGSCYIAPAHIYLGPFRRWLEKLLATRIFTLFSPNIWDEADGFGFVRSLLHGTTLGRWVVDRFWDKLSSDVIDQAHLAKHPETKKLIPDQNTFWCGLTIAILNYPTDFFDFVRSGQVKVIREDVACIEDAKTIKFKGGSTVQTDALVCSMGWRTEPSIEFRPKEMHADLGIPSADLTRTQKEMWDRLNARADLEIFERFPRLKSGPKINPDPLVVPQILPNSGPADTAAPKVAEASWRLWRGIVPPAVTTRDLVFLGVVQTPQGALRSEVSSIWAYAYMYDKLKGPFESVTKPSIPLQLGQTLPTEKQLPAAEKGEFDEFMYDTALFNRFGRWRSPWGYGARYPDLAFDGIPYLDLLLRDLGLRSWRKGWGWLGEIFGGAYDAAEYRGLVEEWKQKQEKKDI